jgi:hypothetical protein
VQAQSVRGLTSLRACHASRSATLRLRDAATGVMAGRPVAAHTSTPCSSSLTAAT